MAGKDQELEVKFYIADLPALEARLLALGGRCLQPRGTEINLRFDTPSLELTRSMQVLRLRQDTAARLTYKGPAEECAGARLRREIEFTVSDFAAARALFEALGYSVSMIYEKQRTTYALGQALVTLDELPYGNFTEIEGPQSGVLRSIAERLQLNWEARIPESYTSLFERLRANRQLSFHDLTFTNFSGLAITPADLQVQPADRPDGDSL